jgi:tetratricopeptide (TPR) repeat protein
MAPPDSKRGCKTLLLAALVATIALPAAPLTGQELQLQRNYPGPGPFVCPAPATLAPPTEEEQVRARQLGSDALEASILGDLEGARTLLSDATAADGTSAELAYRHARILEDLGLFEAAILEYCRAMGLGTGQADIQDSRARLDALYEVVRERISDRALEGFVSGLDQADAGFYELAVESFSVAVEETPGWAAPLYNRAVVLEQLGRYQESLADYRQYLVLTPSEVDASVMSVSERIGMIEGELSRPTPSPGNALALGVLFPGMGQYYSGRRRAGTLVLGAALGVVATGIAFKKVTVRCLVPVSGGEDCPSDQIVDEMSERPYLWPALGVTGAVMVGAAIEAWVRARRERAAQGLPFQPEAEARGVSFEGPSIEAQGNRLDVNVLRVRFR